MFDDYLQTTLISTEKCVIRMQRVKFLENVITTEGISPEKTKMDEFLQFEKIQMPKTIKQIKPLFGFSQFVRIYMPELGTKSMPFYDFLKKDRELEINEEHREILATIKQVLLRATELTLQLPKPGQQYVIFCDVSYNGTEFVLLVEDYVKENNTGEKKTYATVSFGSIFTIVHKPKTQILRLLQGRSCIVFCIASFCKLYLA